MSRFFRAKDKNGNASDNEETKNTVDHRDFQVRDLYKKGINHMSNDKLSDAIRSFELALRLDPKFVDAANGNFKVQNQTLIDSKVGDPRWLK